jgi:hypothetical protein
MIIKGSSRSNGKFFAKHLMNTKDNERVRLVEFKGFARENIDAAFRDMEIAAKGTRCKNYFYHSDLNPQADEELTDEQWAQAVDTLERHLGLEGQPRFVVEHEKEGKDGMNRIHRHVIWQRIDPDTMTARSDSLTYQKHENAAREIETACGLQPVASVLVKDRSEPRPERRAKDWEGFRAVRSGLDWKLVQNQVTELWHLTDNGAAFKAALAEKGYILCRGDRRDFVIVDPAGDDHSLPRRIRGVNAADVRERMKNIDRDFLPSVEEGRKLADAWGDGSEAAAAVRWKQGKDEIKHSYLDAGTGQGFKTSREWNEYLASVQPSVADKAAGAFGKGVKEVAKVGQDTYRRIRDGVREETTADRMYKIMTGKDVRQEPEWVNKVEKDDPEIER